MRVSQERELYAVDILEHTVYEDYDLIQIPYHKMYNFQSHCGTNVHSIWNGWALLSTLLCAFSTAKFQEEKSL